MEIQDLLKAKKVDQFLEQECHRKHTEIEQYLFEHFLPLSHCKNIACEAVIGMLIGIIIKLVNYINTEPSKK